MWMSLSTTSTLKSDSSTRIASSAFDTSMTWKPRPRRKSATRRRTSTTSSATRTVGLLEAPGVSICLAAAMTDYSQIRYRPRGLTMASEHDYVQRQGCISMGPRVDRRAYRAWEVLAMMQDGTVDRGGPSLDDDSE